MNTLKLTITGYDAESHSLLVSFASDTTASPDPSTYPSYAFQPLTMWPDLTDVQELKKRIAIAGMHCAESQEAKEKFMADTQRIAELKNLVGQTCEFTVAELLAPPDITPIQVV
jgi:hypothetical protein